MNFGFMVIFDVVVGVLGAYLGFSGIKNYKASTIEPMMITTDELTRVTDVAGMSKFLMPKLSLFGFFCLVFGIQGFLNDAGIVNFPKTVNVIFLIAFLAVFIVFSYHTSKAKRKYIH